MTECRQGKLEFQGLFTKKVEAEFNGGDITSDAGILLLREIEKRFGIIQQFADCFEDYRDQDQIEFSVYELLTQRVFGIAAGYEDLNDHDELRSDPVFAAAVGREDPTGMDRSREQDMGKALAGKSTLNRLELEAEKESDKRYKKFSAIWKEIEDVFVDYFMQLKRKKPRRLIFDLDATDDPLHGNQEGRFFHGYYDEYCYLPLYIFCGDDLLCAKLRESGIDASAGSVDELGRIVRRIRNKWPDVHIMVRGDSAFCREDIMRWCEENDVEYVFGIAKNERLKNAIAEELDEAQKEFAKTGRAARVYKDFMYRTLDSWSRSRRIIGKAEYLAKGGNPRFVVTSYSGDIYDAKTLYEKQYCPRGDMENRIKEQQLYLFSDRTSSSKMRANQLRLWFSSLAYVLMNALRKLGLKRTKLERAQCHTIREKLFKIGALVRISVRRVYLMLASGYPYKQTFSVALRNIQRCRPMRT
jgi:hypothetical protein